MFIKIEGEGEGRYNGIFISKRTIFFLHKGIGIFALKCFI